MVGEGVLLLFCVGGLDFPSVLPRKQFFTCFLSYLVAQKPTMGKKSPFCPSRSALDRNLLMDHEGRKSNQCCQWEIDPVSCVVLWETYFSHSPIRNTPSGALFCYFQNSFFVFPVLPMVSRVFVGSFLLTCTGIVCWAGVNLMHFSSIARDGVTDAFLIFFYLNQTDFP